MKQVRSSVEDVVDKVDLTSDGGPIQPIINISL